MNPLWFATRATGEVAFLLLTTVAALGILSAAQIAGRRVPRFVLTGLHRNITLVTLVFLALHLVTAIADSFAKLQWYDAVVPFTAGYRPIWLGLGAVALDLLLALTLTSLIRGRLGLRTWRALHWASYACWSAALVHALGTGSDTRTSLVLGLTGVCAAVTLTAVFLRIRAAKPEREGARLLTGLAVGTAATAVLAWTATGPLAPGWARRAGTPVALLAGTGGAPSGGSSSGAPAGSGNGDGTGTRPGGDSGDEAGEGGDGGAAPAGGVDAERTAAVIPDTAATRLRGPYVRPMSGGLSRLRDGNTAVLRISAAFTAPGGVPGTVGVLLAAAPAQGAGSGGEGDGEGEDDRVTAGRATLGTPGDPAMYSGTVRGIDDGRIEADTVGPGGESVHLRITVQLSGDKVTGSVQAIPGVSGGQERE